MVNPANLWVLTDRLEEAHIFEDLPVSVSVTVFAVEAILEEFALGVKSIDDRLCIALLLLCEHS